MIYLNLFSYVYVEIYQSLITCTSLYLYTYVLFFIQKYEKRSNYLQKYGFVFFDKMSHIPSSLGRFNHLFICVGENPIVIVSHVCVESIFALFCTILAPAHEAN